MFIGILIEIANMYLYWIGTILEYIALLLLAIFFCCRILQFSRFGRGQVGSGSRDLESFLGNPFLKNFGLGHFLTCVVYPNRACQHDVLALRRTRTTNTHWTILLKNWIPKRLSLSFPLYIFGNFDHAILVLDKCWTCVDSGHHEVLIRIECQVIKNICIFTWNRHLPSFFRNKRSESLSVWVSLMKLGNLSLTKSEIKKKFESLIKS